MSESTLTWQNPGDGFIGVEIGSYVTLEGEEGAVLQQVGTKVVHVYRRKWLRAVDQQLNRKD